MAGADPDVTARLAKSLLGHPGRKARFLQGPLQDWFGDRNLTLWLCQNSYGKWSFIVDFPIKNGDFP